MFFIIISIILGFALIFIGAMIYGKYQIKKIPNLTSDEVLTYCTSNNPNAVITVGIIKNGKSSFKVYGENSKELPTNLHTYEIGSLTKTFTASLINKAIKDRKINIDDTIDKHLPVPKGNKYPTIKDLLTHTSGYKSFYFEHPMIRNFFKGKNDFYGVTKEMVLRKADKMKTNKCFVYSNYNYAILGLVLESVYDTDYKSLLNGFAQNELGLKDTKISDKSGDLGNYWDWNDNDAYLSAGAVTSNISDMLLYAQIQLEANAHNSLKEINATTQMHKTIGVNMNKIGMSWIIDSKNNIVWHNGGTGKYNTYLGFKPETGTAVVVLSNLAPNYRIPATVLGIKLLSEIDK